MNSTSNHPFAALTEYDHNHLITHAIDAREVGYLHRLLVVETPKRRNAWFESKYARATTASYVDDLARTRALISQANPPELSPYSRESLLVWNAALFASARSLPTKLDSSLVRVALSSEIWSPRFAWDYYRLVVDVQQKSELIRAIEPFLPNDLIKIAFDEWLAEGPPRAWSAVIALLAHRLPAKYVGDSILPHVDILCRHGEIEALTTLLPHMPPSHHSAVLTSLEMEARSSGNRTALVQSIAASLPDELISRAVDLLLDDSPDFGAEGWASLAPRLSLPDIRSILGILKGRLSTFQLGRIYAGLLPRLAFLGELDLALDLANEIDDGMTSSSLKTSILQKVAERDPTQALRLIERISISADQSLLMQALAKALPPTCIDEALRVARSFTDPGARSSAIRALASRMDRALQLRLLREAFADARVMRMPRFEGRVLVSDGLARARELYEFAVEFSRLRSKDLAFVAAEEMLRIGSDMLRSREDDERPELQRLTIKAWAHACCLCGDHALERLASYKGQRTTSINGLGLSVVAPSLSTKQLSIALDGATCVEDVESLGPYLSPQLQKRALHETRLKFYEETHKRLIASLAPYLSKELVKDAVEITQSLHDPLGQCVVLASLASFLPPKEAQAIGRRALFLATTVGSRGEAGRAQVLKDIADFLDIAGLHDAISDAKTFEYSFLSNNALEALLPALGRQGQVETAWIEALSLEPLSQGTIISQLLRLAPNRLLITLPEIVSSMNVPAAMEPLLADCSIFSPSLTTDLFDRLLEHPDSHYRMRGLQHLASNLPETRHQKMIEVVCASDEYMVASRTLALLARHCDGSKSEELISLALDLLDNPHDQHDFPKAVAAIAGHSIAEIERERLLTIIDSCRDTTAKDRALKEVASALSHRDLVKYLDSIKSPSGHNEAIVGLVAALERFDAKASDTYFFRFSEWQKLEYLKLMAAHLSGARIQETLDDLRGGSDHYQSEAIIALMPYLQPCLVKTAFACALEVRDKFKRTLPLRGMMAILLRSPTDTQTECLEFGLGAIAKRDRLDFFYDLASFSPLLYAVGGEASVREATEAVVSSALWWSLPVATS